MRIVGGGLFMVNRINCMTRLSGQLGNTLFVNFLERIDLCLVKITASKQVLMKTPDTLFDKFSVPKLANLSLKMSKIFSHPSCKISKDKTRSLCPFVP